MLHDLRFAIRSLRHRARGSAVVILILGLGIGANALVFSLVEALLLEPLPFPEPDRLVRVYATQEVAGGDRLRVTEGAFFDWRRRARSFDALIAARNVGFPITDSEQPLNPLMRRVSPGYFEQLGVEPARGRGFAPEDYSPGARIAILDFGFWQSYYGGDPGILGRTIELAGEPWEIVGVMPSGYHNPAFPRSDRPVLWLPMSEPAEADRRGANLVVLGRLAAGTDIDDARAELASISAELARLHPETDAGRGVRLLTLRDSLVERLRPALLALFVAVGFVLLLACANVANLLLARAVDRRHEIALRLALGASRGRLLRQLVAESLVLGLAAAAFGLLLAFWTLEPLLALAPTNTDVPLLYRADLDGRVVLYTVVLAVLTALIFGLAPIVQSLRLRGTVLAAARAGQERGRRRWRSSLVTAEVALSLVLLIGAGLMIRTFGELKRLDLGFEPRELVTVRTAARGGIYDAPEGFDEFHRRVADALRDLPGITDVGACEILPMFAAFRPSLPLRTAERAQAPDGEVPRAVLLRATPGFFRVFGTPILRGRGFTDDDDDDGAPVAVVSAGLAERLWGGDDPLGRELVLDPATDRRVRVVGVAGDLRGLIQAPEPPPILYLPNAQDPVQNLSYFLRTQADVETLLPRAEQAIWAISRDAPVYFATAMEQMISDLEWQPRFTSQLLTGFALFALVLAATGLYAVLSYAVIERRREIGVRVALGATRGDVVRLVLAGAATPVLAGLALGVAGALGLGRILASQLYGVTATDVATYAAVAVLFAAVALLASYLPARHATRVDPVEALHCE